ncbi:hypothetical protein Q8W71_06880 [Methylobacterium sp. NEAU 140]|uniref:hypothetical protein n=1 Tax=Methylobacterium sp. NEAU 140 TaxID=3064945 RepID=UPI002737288F|nr:hypothetical protein [Methylobacterium sp. NEAU 140]MDP4022341.1 hypothetical protein [Methylobacterium sp. NEAU 140]
MLTVITPAASTALTTLGRARAILGFANTDDAAATVLIGQASRAIAEHCRRVFALESVRETFTDEDLCGGGPILARSPVVEITSVRSGADLPAPADYRLDATTGRLWRLDASGHVLPWWSGTLVVEYRAGFTLPTDASGAPAPTLPDTVERAAIVLLSTYLSLRKRDPTVKTDTVEGIGSTSWWVPGASDRLASPEAEQLLIPFIRYFP